MYLGPGGYAPLPFELIDLLRLAEIDVTLHHGELCDAHVFHQSLCWQLRRVDRSEDMAAHFVRRHPADFFIGEYHLGPIL